MSTAESPAESLADMLQRLGDISPERIACSNG